MMIDRQRDRRGFRKDDEIERHMRGDKITGHNYAGEP